MTEVLSALWSITKGACLTGAVLLLVRLLFHRVLSAKAKYYLWLLFALRLLLPVVPESPMSLMNFLPDRTVVSAAGETPVTEEAVAAPEASNEPVWWEHDPAAVPDASAGVQLSESGADDAAVWEAPAEPSGSSVSTVLFWVWLGGAGVVLLCYLALYSISGARLRQLPFCTDSDTLRVYLRLKRECGIRGGPRLVAGGAGMLGRPLRPTIVLPAERRAEDAAPILLHELLHYKHGDLWIFLLFQLLTAVYWFNPLVWAIYFLVRSDSEAACDQRVLETGLVRPERYAGILYEEGVLQMKHRIWGHTTFGGKRHSLKRRIRSIAAFRSPKVWVTVLAVALALAVTACTLTGADSASSVQQEDTIQAEAEDFEAYMADKEPPQGVFGLTFAQHTAQGLLNPNSGTLEHYTHDDCDLTFSIFTTTTELGGEMVEIQYNFSQTALSVAEILTQVFVTLPEDVDPEDWLKQISDPWLSGLTRNTDYNGFLWESPEYVADFLTEAQLEQASQALVDEGERSTSPEFPRDLDTARWSLQRQWRVVCAFYQEEGRVWQFNGTGAALVSAARTFSGGNLTIEDLCGDSTLDPALIQAAAENAACLSWDVYQDALTAAIETGDYADVTFSLEGRPAYYIVHKSPDGSRTRAIRFCLVDDSMDEEAWLRYTELVTGKLSEVCPNQATLGYYPFDDGEIHVEFGPVDSGDITVHEDGTSSWAGIPNELGNRILELQITFESGGTSGQGASPSASALTSTISPYTAEGDSVTYEHTGWDMVVSDVISAQGADTERWAMVSGGQPVLHGTSPLEEHPEVTDIYYRFAFSQPELTMGLFRVETHYDPDLLSYEDLVAQRTRELGEPTNYTGDGDAIWAFGEVQLVIYQDRDGRTQEWLSRWRDQYDPARMPESDVDGYIEAVQPSIGRFGWTFEEHVAAGLLDPDRGTLNTEGDGGETFHVFTTEVELGGYTLEARYCFIETLAGQGSGREILSEIQVEPPQGIPLSQWLARFSGGLSDRTLCGQNEWWAPFSVGSLLTEAQREAIAEAMVAQGVAASLDNWYFFSAFYDAPRGWVLNGTGIALYTAAQNISA